MILPTQAQSRRNPVSSSGVEKRLLSTASTPSMSLLFPLLTIKIIGDVRYLDHVT